MKPSKCNHHNHVIQYEFTFNFQSTLNVQYTVIYLDEYYAWICYNKVGTKHLIAINKSFLPCEICLQKTEK